jgi:hypothetical protein
LPALRILRYYWTLLAIYGCSGVRAAPEADQHPGLDVRPRAVIGLSESEPIQSELGIIRGGRILSDGRVILSDYSEPHIKIFDSRGKYLLGFGASGRRPGEFLDLTALAASDSIILTGDSELRRVERRKLDGQVIRTLDDIPLVPLGAVPQQNGEWLLYGPSTRAGIQQTWIHCLSIRGDYAHWESGFPRQPAREQPRGDVPKIVLSGTEAIIAHRFESDSLLIHARCEHGNVSVLDTKPFDHAASAVAGRNSQFLGMGGIAEGLVLAFDTGVSTNLSLLRDNRQTAVTLMPRASLILDSSRNNDLLVLQFDPVPHVSVLSGTLLLRSALDRKSGS